MELANKAMEELNKNKGISPLKIHSEKIAGGS